MILVETDESDGNSKNSENPRKVVISNLLNNSPSFNCLKEDDILEEIYIDDSSQLIKPSLIGIERLNRLVQTSKSRLTVTISRKNYKTKVFRNQNVKSNNFQHKISPESPKNSDEMNVYDKDCDFNYEVPKNRERLDIYKKSTNHQRPNDHENLKLADIETILPPPPVQSERVPDLTNTYNILTRPVEIDLQRAEKLQFLRAKKTHYNAHQVNFTIKRGDVFEVSRDVSNDRENSSEVRRVQIKS